MNIVVNIILSIMYIFFNERMWYSKLCWVNLLNYNTENILVRLKTWLSERLCIPNDAVNILFQKFRGFRSQSSWRFIYVTKQITRNYWSKKSNWIKKYTVIERARVGSLKHWSSYSQIVHDGIKIRNTTPQYWARRWIILIQMQ